MAEKFSNDEDDQLIKLVKESLFMYDHQHPDYTSKTAKPEKIKEIANTLGKTSILIFKN